VWVRHSRASATFQVVDATKGQPLSGVQVTRADFPQSLSGAPIAATTPLGLTQADGTLTCQARGSPVTFASQGYKTAFVFFPDGQAWVVSPKEEAGWRLTEDNERHFRSSILPTSHFNRVSARGVIIVPMWPDGATTAPSPK
jgi:hypothetical protein